MLTLLISISRSAPARFTACERLVRNASSNPNIRNASRMEMNVNAKRSLRRLRFAQDER